MITALDGTSDFTASLARHGEIAVAFFLCPRPAILTWALSQQMTKQKIKNARPSLGFFSVKDAAYYLGIAPRTLRRYATQGDIEYRRVGRLLKFERATLDDFARPVGRKKSTGRPSSWCD